MPDRADPALVPSHPSRHRWHALGLFGVVVGSAAAARALDTPAAHGDTATPSAPTASPSTAPSASPSASAVTPAGAPTANPDGSPQNPSDVDVPASATSISPTPPAPSAAPAPTTVLPPSAPQPSTATIPPQNAAATAAPAFGAGRTTSGTSGHEPAFENNAPTEERPESAARRKWVSIEAVGGPNVHDRFPTVDRESSSNDAVDATLAATVWAGLDERTALGIGYAYVGLGSESFALDELGNSLDASYNLHVLWLRGRWYLKPTWPSFYFSAGLGASLQSVRATGTRSDLLFTAPGRPFECSAIGGFGGAAGASAGGEVKLPSNFAFLAEIEGSGHLMRGASDEFGDCPAPGAGPALQAAVRAGFAYYFPL